VRCRLLLLAAASASLLTANPAHAQRTELKVPVITQQTPVWCWAATASMALRLLGFPDINPSRNYQCGVVAAAFPDCDDDCTKCVTTLGSMTMLVGILDRYRDLSLALGHASATERIKPNYVAYPGWIRIKHSIDLSYPVIAGISPDGKPDDPADSQHTVLITGYDDNYRGTGEAWVILKDPYPYDRGGDPYASAGYSYDARSGKAQLPWRVLRDRMNLTSAVFLETPSA
jgi:Papain-like cysteine protease AvrRpt2